jgi:hypothetical protein
VSRWLLLLIAVVGGGIVAYVTVLIAAGGIVGLLRIFVFGDDSWPTGWEIVVTIIIGLIGFYTWFVAARHIWNRFKPLL